MPERICRRSFIGTSLLGMGGLAMGSEITPFLLPGGTGRNPITGKMLMATTDVVDNILINHNGSRYGKKQERSEEYYKRHACFFDLNQLDSLHRCLASLGVSRHQWIVDNITLLYENYPHRFDLLEEAIKSAHRHHLEFYAVLKPFEGADCSLLLPHTMPCPDHIAFSDLRGIIPGACPFVADHPEMSLKYRPGTSFIRKPVSHICLVKGDDRPTRVRPAHLSLFTSPTNNHFIPYSGSISFRETIESRYRFPYWRQCRIIHLDNLTIPPDHRYVLIRCSLTDSNGDFSNETGSIIELLDSGGMTIPDIVSTGPVSFEEHNAGFYRSRIMKDITRYLQHPDVRDEVADRQKMEQHYSDYFRFGDYHPGEITTLDAKGYIAAAAGKPDFMYGNLHPVYPEVQEHWLEMCRFCLDRGADGINFRVANHILSPDCWDYGFNDPAIAASGGNTGHDSIGRANGDAYTRFLHKARDLIKSRGKKVAIHLNSDFLFPDDRPLKLPALPANFEWQWEKWVREIGDEFEFRGVFKLRPWHLQQALDIFSTATRAAGKPFYLQGDFHGMAFEGPFTAAEEEIKLTLQHPGLNGYNYYETANITRLDDNGVLEGSPGIREILNRFFPER